MYELKCKAIALAAEAQAFKAQEQREKRLLHKWKARAALGRLKATQRGETLTGQDPKECYSTTLQGIHLHRVNQVRKEARNALLAYGFLRGVSYRRMENFSWTQPNWDRVEKLALRYYEGDSQIVLQRFAQWRDEGLGGVPARWCESIQPGSMRNSPGSRDPRAGTYNADWIQMQIERNKIWPKINVQVMEDA